MKEMGSDNFKYSQKNIIIGNKVRSVITIDKKPGTKIASTSSTSNKTVSIRKKRCSGCSRKRRI